MRADFGTASDRRPSHLIRAREKKEGRHEWMCAKSWVKLTRKPTRDTHTRRGQRRRGQVLVRTVLALVHHTR